MRLFDSIADIDVSLRIDSNPARPPEHAVPSGSAITPEAVFASCDDRYVAIGRDRDDSMPVNNQQVLAVERHAGRRRQTLCDGANHSVLAEGPHASATLGIGEVDPSVGADGEPFHGQKRFSRR